MFYILKMITIKEIREILAEHKTKQEGMFTKHEKLVSDLISGHQTLLKQRLDELCDSLTSVKTDVEELKESHSFTQNDIDQRLSNINEKVQNLEKELNSTKEGVVAIQTTEPRALEIRRKLVDLEDRSRRNHLQILGIKEDPRKSWEECENKICNMLEENWIWTQERAYCVEEKSNDKERAIVVQFSFYKDKINILRNCNNLRELKFPYSKIFPKRQWKFVKKNGRRY